MKKKLLLVLILMIVPFFTFGFGIGGKTGQLIAADHYDSLETCGYIDFKYTFLSLLFILFISWIFVYYKTSIQSAK